MVHYPFRKNKQNKNFLHDLFYFFKNRTGSPVPSTKERPFFFFFLQLYPRRFTVWSRHREINFLTPLNILVHHIAASPPKKNKKQCRFCTRFLKSATTRHNRNTPSSQLPKKSHTRQPQPPGEVLCTPHCSEGGGPGRGNTNKASRRRANTRLAHCNKQFF